MKRIVIFCFGFLLLCTCQKTAKTFTIDTDKLLSHFDYRQYEWNIRYETRQIEQNQLNIRFIIQNSKKKYTIDEQFIVNTKVPYLGTHISTIITTKAKELAAKNNLKTMVQLSYLLDNMLDSFAVNKNRDTLLKIENQGLFIVNSLIKSAKRQIKNKQNGYIAFFKNHFNGSFPQIYTASFYNENTKSTTSSETETPTPMTLEDWKTFFREEVPLSSNTTYEGFNRGLSPYLLNEDIYVNIAQLNQKIKDDPSRGGILFQPLLQKIHKPAISLQELLLSFRDFYREDLEKGFLLAQKEGKIPQAVSFPEDIDELGRFCFFGGGLQGSDHGCCGNYSGCCAFWHPICRIHDELCTRCDHWYCLWGCVPDKAMVPVEPPRTIEDELGDELLNLRKKFESDLANFTKIPFTVATLDFLQ